MKRIVFPFLGMVMLGLSSCMKPGENIQDFQYVPASVLFDIRYGLMLNTPIGLVGAQKIQNAGDLWEGDLVLAFFTVNYDQQASEEYFYAYDLDYVKIEQGYATGTSGGESTSNDYNFPIEVIVDVFGLFEHNLFLALGHKAPEDQKFIYEMTFDRDVQSGRQEVKIRAKKNGEGTKPEKNIGYPYAFNIRSLLNNSTDVPTKFVIYFKTGVDNDGNEKFTLLTDGNGNSEFEDKFKEK